MKQSCAFFHICFIVYVKIRMWKKCASMNFWNKQLVLHFKGEVSECIVHEILWLISHLKKIKFPNLLSIKVFILYHFCFPIFSHLILHWLRCHIKKPYEYLSCLTWMKIAFARWINLFAISRTLCTLSFHYIFLLFHFTFSYI